MGYDSWTWGGRQLRDQVDGSRIANSLRMLRGMNKHFAFLLVEGDTDRRLFSKFIDKNKCKIQTAENKDNVIEAISILNSSNFGGVLGVIDADFMHLEGKKCEVNNVILTDTHDIETLMLNSSALESLIAEYANRDKLMEFERDRGENLTNVLLQNTSVLGYLRWFSLRNRADYDFKTIRYHIFTDCSTLSVNLTKLVSEAINQSPAAKITDCDLTIQRIQNMMLSKNDLWQVCCGHDMVQLLLIGLKSVFGGYNSKALGDGALEGSLRMCFEYGSFAETKSYAFIIEWEKQHAPYQILRHFDRSPLSDALIG